AGRKPSVPGATGFGGNARGSFAQELVEANDGGRTLPAGPRSATALADRLPQGGGRSSACLPAPASAARGHRGLNGRARIRWLLGVCETTGRDPGRPPRTRRGARANNRVTELPA